MKCIYCGAPLSNIDYCTGCGADITIQKRIIRISNLLYNQGLEKATVRDLSGAIVCLKRSLKFNKENIAARNLLGLVYFETGEVVSALSEWVISKNMNVEGNLADYYIEKLQANKNKLDTINHTIRKYNQALVYCKEDNEDMAIIQLKKVLQQNPKLIKAYHLLSLLYLRHQEYEKARKLLRKAAYIDATNTTTLRYLREVEMATGISTSLDVRRKKKYTKAESETGGFAKASRYLSGNELIIQPGTFRESSTVATFINIFLGLILGGAIVYFLVVPATRQSIYADANVQVTDANSTMAAEVARVQGLENQIEEYASQVEEANKSVQDADKKVESYDKLLEASNYYLANQQNEAAQAFAEVDEASITGNGKELYASLETALSSYVFNNAYTQGTTAYVQSDWPKAITNLKAASEANPDSYEAMYYLGFAYYNSGDTANANTIFQEIVQKFPAQAGNVQSYITAGTGNGGSSQETDASGNPVGTGETDAGGNPVGTGETDASGNPVGTGETDETGNPITVQ